ncbi:MAG TPA: PA0069 family radical SAM protein [Gammaproteobacteria bacterium]|nr:PA0069 family radical SAM protein [Gammaproteobacteria bacterium]
MGTGAFAREPEQDSDYKAGYLCGLVRGDGLLASYSYQRAGRVHGDQHQFRRAMIDDEALTRAAFYLREANIDTQELEFQKAVVNRQALRAIRTHARANVDRIRNIIEWPDEASGHWCKGFLAGIFDAEGSCSNGILRIPNTDHDIIQWLVHCLERLSFQTALERASKGRNKPITTVRLRGGLREQLRFFHLTDPAILRKRDIQGKVVKSNARLRVIAIEELPGARRLFDITTGTGDFIANGVVSHNCYARPSHAYLNLSPGLDFETRLFFKPNAAERLEQELSRPGYRCRPITLGANTDPYQPVEKRLRVTRGILEVLQRFQHPVTIITKSALVERDIDLLAPMARDRLAVVMCSVTTLDNELKRTLEPRTSSPAARLRALAALHANGIPAGVMVAPVIPAVNDSEIEAILGRAAAAGASTANYVLLRLPYELKALFAEWLHAHLPDRAEHVLNLIRDMRGGELNQAAFGARMRGSGRYAEMIAQRFRLAQRRYGLNRREVMPLDRTRFRVPSAQIDFWNQ